MKTIGCMKDLVSLQYELAMNILLSCPWMAEPWDVEAIGYVFIIDDSDIDEVASVYVPVFVRP